MIFVGFFMNVRFDNTYCTSANMISDFGFRHDGEWVIKYYVKGVNNRPIRITQARL